MAIIRDANTKNFAIILGTIAGVIIIVCFSDTKEEKIIIKDDSKEEEIIENREDDKFVEESGQWDSDKWGWRNYDARYRNDVIR
ncbi:hypothetical protein GVAV_000739 [Gurleya vavrai]